MNDTTELVIIIDRSGSMHPLKNDVIGGFNALIDGMKKEGETKVTTIFFSSSATYVHEGVDIKDVAPLTEKDYIPGGSTALLDAVGDAIAFIKSKHAKLKAEELPAHVIFSIMTDGMENASKEYTYPQIHDLIEFQKKCGWEFLFQAANIDVAKESSRLGIDNAFSFAPTKDGIFRSMCTTMSFVASAKKRKE